MKKRTKRFDAGGMASSGPQYAFDQPRTDRTSIFQATPDTGTGIGGVGQQPQPMQQEQPMQMKKGGKVKTKRYDNGGDVDAPSRKYDNQRYTGMVKFDDNGETYDTYRDVNRVERYDDPKNKRALTLFSDTKKMYPPAVLARDRAEENRPKGIKKYAKGGAVKSRGDGCAQRGKTKGTMR
jgi:hypothetical protein